MRIKAGGAREQNNGYLTPVKNHIRKGNNEGAANY